MESSESRKVTYVTTFLKHAKSVLTNDTIIEAEEDFLPDVKSINQIKECEHLSSL
jgi:hypothetical protein